MIQQESITTTTIDEPADNQLNDGAGKRPIFSPKRAIKRAIERQLFKDTKAKNYELQMKNLELQREVIALEYRVKRFKKLMTEEQFIAAQNLISAEIEDEENKVKNQQEEGVSL